MKKSSIQPKFSYPTHILAGTVLTYQNLVFLVLVIWLAGCAQATPAIPGAIYREETVVLPTGVPKPKPTPVGTRVIPIEEALTPAPTPTITPIPDEVRALVVKVLDGDTINVVMEGDPPGRTYTVRYLGIDAPPNTPSVPWGGVAFEVNRKLTSGKVVRLERDQSDADADGNLLRYVFLGDDLLSITMAEQGVARADISEPDTRFQKEILEAESRAKTGQLGLWGKPPTLTPRPASSPTEAITSTTTLKATVAVTTTTATETTPTVEPEVTAEATPTSRPSATPELQTTGTPQTEEESPAGTATSAGTIEPTPTGSSSE